MWIKNLSQVYSLIVCLVASMVLMVSSGLILSKSLSFFAPEWTNSYEFSKYYSNEAYLKDFENQHSFYDSQRAELEKQRFTELKTLDESALTSKRLQEEAELKLRISAGARAVVLESMLWFLVGLIFFAIHWSLFRRFEKQVHSRANTTHPIRPRTR